MPNPNSNRIPGSRVQLVDARTGFITTEWFNFLSFIYQEILWMSSTTDVLFGAKAAENAQTTQYTSPNKIATIIDKFTARNYSGAAVTLSVNIVTSGGAAASSNLVVSYTLAAGETYIFPEVVGQYLEPGDFISTLAGAATSVSIRACGRQIPV